MHATLILMKVVLWLRYLQCIHWVCPVILVTQQLCSNTTVKNVSRMCVRVNKQTNKLQLITAQVETHIR